MDKPSYLSLYTSGELQRRAEQALTVIKHCRLCPRECGVDRSAGERGYCHTDRLARVASYAPHFGEESPLVGRFGSGTIFFSCCNLLCSFCQNYDISHGGHGVEVNASDLAAMMIALQESGCHNINFVTPTHVVPQILEGLVVACNRGLTVPLVYNTSGYERVETLKLLDGIFDIYMPDFKFWNDERSLRYCNAPDYRDRTIGAIAEMHRQVGDLTIDTGGIATRGLLVRHLVMPGGTSDVEEIMRFLATSISAGTYINIMDQYHPCGRAGDDASINRRIFTEEFEHAVETAHRAGLRRLDRG